MEAYLQIPWYSPRKFKIMMFIIENPTEYIQSKENKSREGCNSSLSHNATKNDKINITRSCNIVKKILRLIFPS